MLKPIWNFWLVPAVAAVSLSASKITPFRNYSSMALLAIPAGLTDDITGLDLASNRIEQIREMDLKFAVNLVTLLLQSNQIQAIDKNAFLFLAKLERLDLSNNNLTHLSPSWFRNLSSLQHLNVKDNYYTELGDTPLFLGLQKLRFLHLGSDYFSAIRKHDMEGISVLEQLEIKGRDFRQYEDRSLHSFQHINHIIFDVRSAASVSLMINDVRDSVMCLELRNLQTLDILPGQLKPLSARKLILRNVVLSDDATVHLAAIVNIMSQLDETEVVDCIFQGRGFMHGMQDHPLVLKVLTVRNLTNSLFYTFSDLSNAMPLVTNIVRLTLENAQVYMVPCRLARNFRSLVYLDLSVNLLQDSTLAYSLCDSAWPKLETLNVSQNSLSHVERVAQSIANIADLANLDISQNNFGHMPDSCVWPANLKYLNISGCKIKELTTCIPQSLEVLDVSNNNIKEFQLSLPHLQELYITSNSLKTLPDAVLIPFVRVLKMQENKVMEFSEQQLAQFVQLEMLDVRNNSFACSCAFLSFIQSHQGISDVLVGWPEYHICDSPSSVRGEQVKVAQLTVTECHRTLVVSLTCVLILGTILAGVMLCYKFHTIWYLQMTWAWLRAKRKPQRAHQKEICYDAFVSYSEHDSEWVENIMVQELELSNPPFKLCLHKRDFLPGKWIVDNIIDSMEKSYKTLFVLSEHFVQSEWCKYELDFSHFRLFDENNDAAILILLEPLPEKTIPKRFCKLRKLMNTKTYLEWPRDEDLQQIFWFNLKTALKS
ncbi:toll-like receptor 2 [Tiliqua scincoides]|uniref:toll-like receptor 2 n=1 Tax=Tiliqua scincoides TaxID=71010 RepID=UPI00346219CB